MTSYSIDMGTLPRGAVSRALTLGEDVLTALSRAIDGEVTYVYAENGALVACIAPPEAGERYEHEETVPVLVRTQRRRRPWYAWGPFEGVFR